MADDYPMLSSVCRPNITDLLQKERPEILAGIGVGMEKVTFGVQKLFSLKRGNIGPIIDYCVLIRRNSHARFRLVPNSTTLDDLEGSLCTLFQNTCVFELLLIDSFTLKTTECRQNTLPRTVSLRQHGFLVDADNGLGDQGRSQEFVLEGDKRGGSFPSMVYTEAKPCMDGVWG